MSKQTSRLMEGGGRERYGSTTSGGELDIGFAGSSSSPFAFDESKFYRLCDQITSNIFGIAKHAGTLEKTLKSIGSANDSKQLRESIHGTNTNASKTISETASYLKQLKSLVNDPKAPGGKEESMRVTRLTNDFQQTVKRFTDLQKNILAKMKSTILPMSRSTSINETEDDHEKLIDFEAQRQQQMQLNQELEFEQGMLLEREERIRQIESDILNVNDIMKELGVLVHEQGDMIDTIEGNIEGAYSQVDTGREELQKAATYQSKYRKRLFCLLGTGFIVLIIVIIILVTSLKH